MKLTWRIWVLIIALILAFLTIAPWGFLEKGALIKSVEKNSSAFTYGLRQGMIIQSVNGNSVTDINSYTNIISPLFIDNSTEQKLIIGTNQGEIILFTNNPPEITVGNIPATKIKSGLDLSGGARALVRPANTTVSSSEINDLIAIATERFNLYGLKDITIRPVKDLQGNNYMLIEIAGATPSDLQDLVGSQGKFEAKIGNDTIFSGGEQDITRVCRNDATCAGIENCGQTSQGNYACRFRFSIYLSERAAQRQANITSGLGVNLSEGSNQYLDKKLDLYLDENLVDSLFISKDLKGKVETQILIQGSGTGDSRNDAIVDTQKNMNKLQTVLLTGSLPYKLEIIKLDTISPTLGQAFMKNIIYLALIVFAIISIVLFVKYRRIKITLAVILTMFSEAFITLGVAALIRWNLDAPSIAGIIAGMGTGVNDQIVIIDESESKANASLSEKIKNAFFIIVGAFFTIIAAMLPLFWAGAGMLKGFALTTILSVCAGILITRPAFADMLKKIKE
jgi:preprotein translocase subunit SecD